MTPTTDIPLPEVTISDNNVRYVTPEEFKKQKKAEKHQEKLKKLREIRWKSPAADAKIEDLYLLIQDFNRVTTALETVSYELFLTRKALFNKGIITQEELKQIRDLEKEREQKFKELQENTEMSKEEKLLIANQYELPLDLLGLVEPTGDGQ
jgi:hypothetical protein